MGLTLSNNKKIYITYNNKDTEFNKDLIKTSLKPNYINKPTEAFWGSPENAEYGWKEWCESNEFGDYDFDNPGFKSGTGHFTQLVWKGSKKIGCGAACNSKNKCYVTCNYYPAGNYIGQFDKNVFRKVSVSDSINAGMSTAGKVFLSIFIILIILIIAFSVFHFVVKKRKLRDIKNYFSKAY